MKTALDKLESANHELNNSIQYLSFQAANIQMQTELAPPSDFNQRVLELCNAVQDLIEQHQQVQQLRIENVHAPI